MTMTVTDADGVSAQSSLQIAVDRQTNQPIVRVGVLEGETPPMTLHGTARRSDDGALVLPDGAPWGWVQAGPGAIDELRGLRSFTIQGWLRPESLHVGSGGNRILFGLSTDRAGIDLVCLADGRLRLAVNQWPDAVQNDSSPGRLQVGRWTRFAVTYDAMKPDANVGWYFSDPADSRTAAPLQLDHQTTYRAGPVGTEIGPLAIGNFNATMQGSGLDRQFRGTIRDLQVLGSRVGGRGALSLETLNAGLTVAPPQASAPVLARPHVVVLTDFPPLDVIPVGAGHGPADRRSDPDDVQSMVRFLLYASEFDVEGLVASSATLTNVARKQSVLDLLDVYDRVDETLRRHDRRYPTAAALRAVTWEGRSGTYGQPADTILGAGHDSEASDAIIRLVDRPDPRPVWFCVWGGTADLAQAIWTVRATRSPAELDRFLSKLRIYAIAKQDGTTQWLLDTFPTLFVVVSERNYMGMFWDARGSDPKLADLDWVKAHIRHGHGALGAAYPENGANPHTPGVAARIRIPRV